MAARFPGGALVAFGLSPCGSQHPCPVPWPSDPPRCCVDLQRVTADRSRFPWFPGSACALFPFGVDPGVFRPAAFVQLPARWVRRSWPYIHPRGPRPRARPRFPPGSRLPDVRPVHSPWGFPAPTTLPARGIPVPASLDAPRIIPSRLESDLVAGFHSRAARLRRFSRP